MAKYGILLLMYVSKRILLFAFPSKAAHFAAFLFG